jgi:predicted metal-dependent phosphotriesterase family hydrolase
MGQFQRGQIQNRPEPSGSSVVKGERSGDTFATTEEQDIAKWKQEHAEIMNAAGIAKAKERSTAEFKASEAKFLAEQARKKKEAPAPAPTPAPAGTTASDAAKALADRKK